MRIRLPYRASLGVDAQVSTTGSWLARFSAQLPQFVEGWRFQGFLSGRRFERENFFGLGNDTEIVDALDDRFFEASETRLRARGTVQRDIVGGLRALVGINAERWVIEPTNEGFPSLIETSQQDGTINGGWGLHDGHHRAGGIGVRIHETKKSLPRAVSFWKPSGAVRAKT